MSSLDRQIQHARRRLTTNVFAHRLSLGVLLGAGLWGLIIFATRLFGLGLPLWHGSWLAALAALLIGLIGTALARPSPLRAAVALDAAAGLKERLSTALVVRGQPDPFVAAAVQDAEKTAGRVHVPSHIRFRPPELWPWSAATVLAALLLAGFMPEVNLLAAKPASENAVSREEVKLEQKVIQDELDKQISKIQELAKDNPKLEDLIKDLKPLELPDAQTVTPEDVQRAAVKRIDEVQDKLKQELDKSDGESMKEMQRMLSQLDPQKGEDPGSKLSDALASGDFDAAKQALQDLMKQVQDAAKNADSPEAKQKLADMQQKMEQLADELSKLSDTVQLQKELENKSGLSAEDAKKLLDQLAKMDPKQLEKELQKRLGEKGVSQKQIQELAQKIQKNQQAQKACKNLSQALSKAAKACQRCQNPGGAGQGSSDAANALASAMGQLSNLEMSEQMMNELQARLSELQDLRDGVCKGGNCYKPGERSNKIGPQGPNEGFGMGSRIGRETTPYNRKPTKLKGRYDTAAVIGQMFVEGPQVRGQATAEELATVASEVRENLDAIERNEVPRQYQRVLREYFERLAGLVREREGASGKAAEDAQP